MSNNLYDLIRQHERRGDFTHAAVTEGLLREAENSLGYELPAEYKNFLETFGHGGIGGIEVLGIGKNGALIFKNKTLEYRNFGMPDELVVIENCDEWAYCINARDGKVVMWSMGDMGYSEAYDGFAEYLQDRINDMLENM